MRKHNKRATRVIFGLALIGSSILVLGNLAPEVVKRGQSFLLGGSGKAQGSGQSIENRKNKAGPEKTKRKIADVPGVKNNKEFSKPVKFYVFVGQVGSEKGAKYASVVCRFNGWRKGVGSDPWNGDLGFFEENGLIVEKTNNKGIAFMSLPKMTSRVAPCSFTFYAKKEKSGLLSKKKKILVKSDGALRLSGQKPDDTIPEVIPLRLFPEKKIILEVRDNQNNGVPGVPVGIISPPPDFKKRSQQWRNWFGCVCKGTTDPSGRCVFVFSQPDFKKRCVSDLYAVPLFPLDNMMAWSKKLTAGDFLGKTIILDEPPSGSIKVTGFRRKGSRVWVYIEEASLGGARPWKGLNSLVKRSKFIESAYLPYSCQEMKNPAWIKKPVGLGLKLRVIGVFSDTYSIFDEIVDGPVLPGEEVSVQIHRPEAINKMVGQLRWLDGGPYSSKPIFVFGGRKRFTNLRFHPRKGHLVYAGMTSEAGGFSVPLPEVFFSQEWDQIRIVPGESLEKEWPCSWFIDLDQYCVTRPIVFPVALDVKKPPLLVQGDVVDSFGKPIAKAKVTIMKPNPKGIEHGWRSVYYTKADQKGRWCFKTEWGWSQVKVYAHKIGVGKSVEVVVQPGKRNLSLVIAKTGRVEGRIWVDKPEYIEKFRLHLEMKPDSPWLKRAPTNGEMNVDPGGHFFASGLYPGQYTFRVRTFGRGEPSVLYELSGVVVEAGKIARPGYLKCVDLRGKIQKVKLQFKDPEGNAIPCERISIHGPCREQYSNDLSSLIILKPTGDPVELVVTWLGKCTKRILCASRDFTYQFK